MKRKRKKYFHKIIRNHKMKLGEIDFKDELGICKVEMHGEEGTVPHIHIIGEGFESFVCTCETKYYQHGYPCKTFNSSELEILNKWFHDPEKDGFDDIENIECINYYWLSFKESNTKHMIPDSKMYKLDYTKMKTFRREK